MNGHTCCPHCGGKSGTHTSIRFKACRMYSWDGEDTDTEGWEVISESMRRCQDCHKPVRKTDRPAAQGPAHPPKEHEPACNLNFPSTLGTEDDHCDCAEIRAFRAKKGTP